jgi:hypothetical protein
MSYALNACASGDFLAHQAADLVLGPLPYGRAPSASPTTRIMPRDFFRQPVERGTSGSMTREALARLYRNFTGALGDSGPLCR